MSERALGFVEEWISEHVDIEDDKPEDNTPEAIAARAKALASQCLAAAAAQGIPASEIHDSIDDLAEFIAGAIAEANERDEHGKEFETDEEIEVLVNPDGFENAAEDASEDDDDEKQ